MAFATNRPDLTKKGGSMYPACQSETLNPAILSSTYILHAEYLLVGVIHIV